MKREKRFLKLTLALTLGCGLGFASCSSDHSTDEIINEVEFPPSYADQIINQIQNAVVEPADPEVHSPYISKVFDFLPAVGQFTNKLPPYVKGDTHADMVRKAEEQIKGPKPKGMISLGGFGGYVVFGFDHAVPNKKGFRDFRILANAFWAAANPNGEASARGGSCEPGAIMVSYDLNKNGLPDDPWFEIAGSEQKRSISNYKITYHKPDPDKEAVKDSDRGYATDVEYIQWEDNKGGKGFKEKNQFHNQSYYPEWVEKEELSFTGRLLPKNAIDESGVGNYWVLYSFSYGYADNAPNNDDESAIDIDWAVDSKGNPVHLPAIHFVKVYTGVNQEAGWLGETSTEVSGAYDLHLKGEVIPTRKLK